MITVSRTVVIQCETPEEYNDAQLKLLTSPFSEMLTLDPVGLKLTIVVVQHVSSLG